jgi:hypothetical protein
MKSVQNGQISVCTGRVTQRRKLTSPHLSWSQEVLWFLVLIPRQLPRRPRRRENEIYLSSGAKCTSPEGLIQSVHDSKIVVKVSVQERRQLSKELETAKINHGNSKLRLDRDDSHVAFGKARQNLINLFTGDVSPFLNSSADSILSQNRIARNRHAWLRNTVVKLHAPQYRSDED